MQVPELAASGRCKTGTWGFHCSLAGAFGCNCSCSEKICDKLYFKLITIVNDFCQIIFQNLSYYELFCPAFMSIKNIKHGNSYMSPVVEIKKTFINTSFIFTWTGRYWLLYNRSLWLRLFLGRSLWLQLP
jgi:hypothetical protein